MTDRNAHIPDAEILQDIAETEREIAEAEREIPHLRALGDRWSNMKASARVSGIVERRAFIVKLRSLLAARGVEP